MIWAAAIKSLNLLAVKCTGLFSDNSRSAVAFCCECPPSPHPLKTRFREQVVRGMCFITPLSTLKWCSFVEWTYSNSCTPQLCVSVCVCVWASTCMFCFSQYASPVIAALMECWLSCATEANGGQWPHGTSWNAVQLHVLCAAQCNCGSRRWLQRSHEHSLALQSFMKLPKHANFWQILDSQKWDTNKACRDVDLGLQAGTVRRSLSTWSNVLLFVLIARLLFGCLNPRNLKMVTCISPNGYMSSPGRLHTGWTVPLS